MVAKPRYCSKSLQKQESLRKRNNSTSSTSKQKNIRIVKLNCRVKSNCQRNPQNEIEPAKCEQNLQNISGIHLLLWNPRTICWVRKTTSYFCSLQYPWQNKCAVKFYAIHSWAEIPRIFCKLNPLSLCNKFQELSLGSKKTGASLCAFPMHSLASLKKHISFEIVRKLCVQINLKKRQNASKNDCCPTFCWWSVHFIDIFCIKYRPWPIDVSTPVKRNH